jgi:hypothetical protein
MRMIIIAGLSASTLLTACAPTSDSTSRTASGVEPARRCFSTLQVQNFRQGRMDEVYLRVGRNDVYRLDAIGGCGDLDFANRLAIVSDLGGAGGDRVCSDDTVRVIVPGSTSPASVCRARISRQLTTEEVAALPERQRP